MKLISIKLNEWIALECIAAIIPQTLLAPQAIGLGKRRKRARSNPDCCRSD
jgi:hypothetical protein